MNQRLRVRLSLRDVHGDEFHVAVHQVGDEDHIARQPIEAGNQKHGPAPTGLRQRGEQLLLGACQSLRHPIRPEDVQVVRGAEQDHEGGQMETNCAQSFVGVVLLPGSWSLAKLPETPDDGI
jgi:hypothetical protein